MEYTFENVEEKEFVPRTKKANEHVCSNKTTVFSNGRIEYVRCDDCGLQVWS